MKEDEKGKEFNKERERKKRDIRSDVVARFPDIVRLSAVIHQMTRWMSPAAPNCLCYE